MQNTPSTDNQAPLFKYQTKSARQRAGVYQVGPRFFFTTFPGLEPKRGSHAVTKTCREVRKDAGKNAPKNLYQFFNAQQRRKRFNLAPGSMLQLDIYELPSLKRVQCFNEANFTKFTTRDLAYYFSPHFYIHILDPKPMPKDFLHKNGILSDSFNISNINLNPGISRAQGNQIITKIKATPLKMQRGETEPIDVLNWGQLIPPMEDTQTRLPNTTLHMAIGIYNLKIGPQAEAEGYLISLNDKGPMMVIDGTEVECRNPDFSLEFGKKAIQMRPSGVPTVENFIKVADDQLVPEVSMFQFERDITAVFTPKPVLPPEDGAANRKKTNRYHGEFKILNHLAHHLGLLDTPDKHKITGEIFILSEKTPCYGCLDLFWNQFNELFPNIHLKYNFVYGLRSSKQGFQPLDLQRENSPIIVPLCREGRSDGFSLHSEFLRMEIRPGDKIATYLASFKSYDKMKHAIKKCSDLAEIFKKLNFPFAELGL